MNEIGRVFLFWLPCGRFVFDPCFSVIGQIENSSLSCDIASASMDSHSSRTSTGIHMFTFGLKEKLIWHRTRGATMCVVVVGFGRSELDLRLGSGLNCVCMACRHFACGSRLQRHSSGRPSPSEVRGAPKESRRASWHCFWCSFFDPRERLLEKPGSLRNSMCRRPLQL